MKKIYLSILLMFCCFMYQNSWSQVIQSFPYMENFDGVIPDDVTFAPFAEPNPSAMPAFWINETGDGADWYGRSTTTGSSNTGPLVGDHTSGGTGGVYVFVEDGSNNNPAVTLSLDSVDLSGFPDALLSYWVSSVNSTAAPDNYMLVFVDNGSGPVQVDSVGTLGSQDWFLRNVDLSAYADDTVKISWSVNNSNQNFQHDIAIDDVMIAPPPASDDAGVTGLISPMSGACLSAAEQLEVTISNFGINDVVDPQVGYSINGGTAVIETANVTITSGGSASFTFTATEDMSTIGTYNISAWTDYGADLDNTNDTTMYVLSPPAMLPTADLGNDTTICDGLLLTLSTSTTYAGYLWSDGSTNATLDVNTAGDYSVTITDAVGCQDVDTLTVSTTAFTPPALGNDTIICDGSTITLDAGTYDLYLWSTGSTSQSVTALSAGSYSVTVSEISTSCTASSAISIGIITPTSTITMPTTYCEADGAVTISVNPAGGVLSGAGISGSTFDPMAAGPGNHDIIYDYSVSAPTPYMLNTSGTFSPLAGSGTVVVLGDDQVSTALPIGFAFDFFGVPYTDFYISSNGFIAFQDDGSGCCSGQVLPNAGTPNNLIAFSWTDMNPNDGGTIEYFTLGTSPNQVLVVNITGLAHYGSGGAFTNTTQILLYEGTNIIEMHVTDAQDDGGVITMGIENQDGTAAYSVPGRNGTNWSASNDFVQFVPGVATVCPNSDTVNVDVFASPVLELGADTSICDPSIYTLDAGNSGSTYVWQDGSTNQTFDVDTTGTYGVTVTSPDACVAIDSIHIVDIAAPIVDLGNDTTICIGEVLTLDVTIPTAVYAWSTSETTPTIDVSTSGQYAVSVTKCATTVDMISVTVQNLPTPDLGPDLFVCYDDTITLDAGSYNTYEWSVDGSTGQFISDTTVSCEYTLEMFDSFGDGWNGALFDLYEDGNLVGNYTFGTGSVSVTAISVSPGSMLSVDFTSGGFPGEESFNFIDGLGNVVYSDGPNPTNGVGVWSGMAVCPAVEGEVVVTVTDAIGCAGTDTIQVGRSNPMLELGSDTAICDGEMVTFDAGTHAGYLWSDASTNPTLDATTSGMYYVTVTDTVGCTKVDSVMLSINALPTVNLGNDTSICDGTTLNIDAGAGMMVYNWNDGWVSQIYMATMAGTYSVTVTDVNGCMGWDSIDVSTISVMVSTSTTDATCGNSDGSVSAAASAGMSPYTYMWSNGSTDANTTGLPAGLYDVTATDSYGCEGSASTNVVNADGPQVSSVTVTDNLCNGDSDGSIDISVTGGVTPYTFMWNNGSTDMNISGLTQGTYDVTVSDNNSCNGFQNAVLTDPASLSVATTVYAVSCNGGSDGMLDAGVMGGTTPYSYMWDNGETTASVSGLAAGDYSWTVTDANGCMENTSVTLGEPSALTMTTTVIDANCNNSSDGIGAVTVTGGTLFYDYMWSNGSTDMFATGLAAGSYGVTVTDGNGCMDMASVSVNEPAALATVVTVTDATCGNADGSASVAVTGGTTPYNYGWSNGGFASSISAVVAGAYSVTVMDNNGCEITDNATIVNSNGPTANIGVVDPSCNGDSDGSATASISGGTTPYSYMWSNGSTDASASGLAAGAYQLTITDGGGCTGYASTSLTDPSVVSITASATDETFSGADNGTATAAGSGGTGAFSYMWSNSATDASISGLAPNTYGVTASDANGCSASTTVSVAASTVTCNLSASATSTDATCNGDMDGTATATATGAFGTAVYDWSNGDNTAAISGLGAGAYTVTVTDSLNCSATASVTVSEPAALFITLGPDSTVCDNVGMTLDPGAGFTSYAWSTTETTQTIDVNTTGTYSVTVTDAGGCTATDDVVVTATTCGGIDETANVFGVDIYPNPSHGDFVLNINSPENNECDIMIYSVDGKLIYSENVQLNGFTTKAIDLDVATGVYSLEVRTSSETSVQRLVIK